MVSVYQEIECCAEFAREFSWLANEIVVLQKRSGFSYLRSFLGDRGVLIGKLKTFLETKKVCKF